MSHQVNLEDALDVLREIVSFYWDVDSEPLNDARRLLAEHRGETWTPDADTEEL